MGTERILYDAPLIYRVILANTTNGALILTGKRSLSFYDVTNKSAAQFYVKLYNKATAPTVGTDAPIYTFGCPAGSNRSLFLPSGINFALGLGIAVTAALADADVTAVAAGDGVVQLGYA